MVEGPAAEFIAECFWPGVRDADLSALDERVSRSAAAVSGAERPVHYLGSLLMREDEVVLCLFAGEPDAVRRVAHEAQVPFERLLEAGGSPWRLADRSEP